MDDNSSEDGDDAERSKINEALHYARYGLRVFPTHAVTKRPLPGYGWVELASSQTNHVYEDFERAIQEWGAENVSVAWALGLDGYLAVDIDVDEAHWPEFMGGLMPQAMINVTKRGQHLIFKMPPDFDCGNGLSKFPEQGWGEIRGKGGYVLIAGPDRPGFDLAQLEHAHTFPFPEWLSEYGGKTDCATQAEVRQFMKDHTTASRPNKLVSLTAATKKYDRSRDGTAKGRHDFLIWMATCAAQDALAGYYPAEAAFVLCKEWWISVVPPERWGREFNGIITWAVGKAWANAGVTTTPTPTDDEGQDESPTLSLIEGISPLLQPLDWSTFRQRERHADDWLVEGFWPRRRAMLCHAKAGTGKSELALYVASCMAMGADPWTGHEVEPIRVAYFDFEMDEDQVDDRLNDLGFDDAFNLADLEDLRYFVLPPIAKLDTSTGAEAFLGAIEHERCEAVIIDTFSRVITDNENDAVTVQRFYEFTGIALKRQGIGQWRIDHTGKDAAKGARGSSAKNEDVDFVWEMRRTDDNHGLRLTPTKQRANVDNPLVLERIDEPFVRYRRAVDISTMTPGKDVTSKVYELEGLAIDPSWGFDKVRQVLVSAGVAVGRKSTLQAAIRWRRDAKMRGAVIAKGQVEPAPGLRLISNEEDPDD
jgi:RecA-family ATPase